MNKKLRAELDAAAAAYSPRNRPWTHDDLEIAVTYYGKVPIDVLAGKLKRTIDAVRRAVRDKGGIHG